MNFTATLVIDFDLCSSTKGSLKRFVTVFMLLCPLTILCHGESARYGINSLQIVSQYGDGAKANSKTTRTSAENASNEDPSNEAPVITGQTPDPSTGDEDQSITIELSNLLVTDADSNYPTGFSLQLYNGDHYTLSANTVIPEKDFSGDLVVPVTVNDGTSSSNTFGFKITITPVNDKPVITGQSPNPIVTNEDTPFSVSVGELQVTDPDSAPSSLTLEVLAGTNYTFSGTTVSPAENFSGNLQVSVRVSDGITPSDPFNVSVNVVAINDVPVISSQTPNPLTTAEDTPITIQLSNLVVSDPDDAYPTGFTLSLSAGDNYSVNGNSVVPNQNYSGALTVPIVVNDGEANSNTFNLSITVSNVNDPPKITGQKNLTVDEDNSIQINLTDLEVTDADGNYPNGYSLIVASGANYSVNGTVVTPSPNYFGSLNIPVKVNDGTDDSEIFALQITVNPINDVPVITSQQVLTTSENQPMTLTLSNLNVTDPDDPYPANFTLSVSPGENYSVNGTTITPANGFNGELTVMVKVNDGDAFSNDFPLKVNITPVNDPPTITGQRDLVTAEEAAITILLTDLTVTDSDNSYPTSFVLKVSSGNNYSVSGATVTPVSNFTGTLSVPIVVNDGTDDSAPFTLQITVTPSNDAPTITGQVPMAINEDESITLEFNHLTVVDPDNSYPTGFSIIVNAGQNYTFNGTTVAPAKDFSGQLHIPVQVSDGSLSSNVFTVHVTVNAVNDSPVITGQQPLSTPEDTPIAVSLNHLFVNDPDNSYPTGFTMQIAPGEHYILVGNIITPELNFSGTLNISVTVNDGNSTSAPFVLQIQVGDSNDPPVITGQASLSVNEEESITIMLSHLTVSDPDNTYPDGFSLLISEGKNYVLSGSTITPTANFFGTLTVPVRVNDGVNNSQTFDLKIQVNPINDAPYFDPVENQRMLENSSAATVKVTNINAGPNESDQQITFVVTSSNTGIIPDPKITYDPSSRSAKISYAPNANVSGTVNITILAIDNGATGAPNQNSFSRLFQVTVDEINNAPTLDPIGDRIVQEDAAQLSIDLTGISAGPGEIQNLVIEVSTDKPELFEVLSVVYTSPQSTGRLDVKPKPNANGAAKVVVKITDSGSSTPPSINSSSRAFTFTIQAVNDAPVFTSKPVTLAVVNEQYEYIAEVSDVESNSLIISGISIPSWATLTQSGSNKARLSGVAPVSASGQSTVTLQVNDAGTVVQQQFNLVVNARPVVKSFEISLQEDVSYRFTANEFTTAYSDINQQPISKILITTLPSYGKLFRDEIQLKLNDTVSFSTITSLFYKPNENYFGKDNFSWKASDPYSYSLNAAQADITITPVNDAPSFDFEIDSLAFEVNGEPKPITEIFHVQDPDSDSLTQAEVGFRPQNFRFEVDVLTFVNGPHVKGTYDYVEGKISFTGAAPISEYEQVIKSVKYNHLNTLDPILEEKSVYLKLNDGKTWGEPKDRIIELRYTFIELEIPSGFTPNGDGANDLWVITRPGGLDALGSAVIRIFNRRGMEIYKTNGFDRMWDGTMNGETLPADSYFYTIDLKLRSKKTYKGVVTILR
jgi:gliding motility-associated-like protein